MIYAVVTMCHLHATIQQIFLSTYSMTDTVLMKFCGYSKE